MKTTFRQATLGDLEGLLLWIREYYAFDHIPFEGEAIERGLRVLLLEDAWGGAWFIEQGQEVIGYFVLTFGFDLEFGGKQATLTELYLRPQSRGSGAGRATIAFIEEQLSTLGVGALELQAERSNKDALAFYQRLGFVAHERVPLSKPIPRRQPGVSSPQRLTGTIGTNCGHTALTLTLSAGEATLAVYSRWMGTPASELTLRCEHRATGTHAGVLLLRGATEASGAALSLPPSDGVIVLEYLRVPSQAVPYAGSETMEIVGHWTSPFSMLLWLHRDSHFDDGTELGEEEYDPPRGSFARVAEALTWLESPCKLA